MVLANKLKNVVFRRLIDLRRIRDKPSLADQVDAYLLQRKLKDERLAFSIKKEVVVLHENMAIKNFEDQDMSFGKVIIHAERLIKLSTAQTVAIDSLEMKVRTLSKRFPEKEIPNQLIVFRNDKKMGKLMKNIPFPKVADTGLDIINDENNFCKQFNDPIEDNFDSSSGNDEERLKDIRLDRLGEVIKAQKIEAEKVKAARWLEEQKTR